jgi:LysM repeat protein
MHRELLILLFIGAVSLTPIQSLAQDNAAQAAAAAERRENEDRYKRLNAMFEELSEAFALQQKKIGTLVDEINRLREENSQFQNKQSAYASREDLRKLAEKVQEIDQKREADKKLILEEIQRIAKIASTPPPVIERKTSSTKPIDTNENFYPYTVQKGDTLSGIINAYNVELKKSGKPAITLEQVKKANPKMNPDRVPVGREILIPVPKGKTAE